MLSLTRFALERQDKLVNTVRVRTMPAPLSVSSVLGCRHRLRKTMNYGLTLDDMVGSMAAGLSQAWDEIKTKDPSLV